jgi:hypothetical protein
MSYLTVTIAIVLATAFVYMVMSFAQSRKGSDDEVYVKPAPPEAQRPHVRVRRGAKDKEPV